MRYLIDTHTSPPVVVLQLRSPPGEDVPLVHPTAQQYADQTRHVLVWAIGPDSVTNPTDSGVVHPTTQQPMPVAPPPPAQGVNLAPVITSGHAASADNLVTALGALGRMAPSEAPRYASSLWGWLLDEVKTLEPAAKEVLGPLLQRLLDQLLQKV